MKYYILFIVFILASTSTRLHAQYGSFDDLNDSFYALALDALYQSDDVLALEYFNKINSGATYYEEVLTNIIGIHSSSGNYTEVLKLCKELEAYGDGSRRKANVFRAMSYLGNDSFQKALDLTEVTLAIPTPRKDYTTLFIKAISLQKLHRNLESIRILEDYLLINFTDPSAHSVMGDAYSELGRYSEALMAYTVAAIFLNGAALEAIEQKMNNIAASSDSLIAIYNNQKLSNQSYFLVSDEYITSGKALKSGIGIGANVDLSWYKQLLAVLKMNKVTDQGGFSHQTYLYLLDKWVSKNKQLFPLLLYKTNPVVSERVLSSKGLQDKFNKFMLDVEKECFLISGTRELNANTRKNATSVKFLTNYNAYSAIQSFLEMEFEPAIPLDSLMVKYKKREKKSSALNFKFLYKGTVKTYIDGYLKSVQDNDKGEKTEYYNWSNKLYFTLRENKKDSVLNYKVYYTNGNLLGEGTVEKGIFKYEKEYYLLGGLYKHIELDENILKVHLYNPKGREILYSKERVYHYLSYPTYDTATIQYSDKGDVIRMAKTDYATSNSDITEYFDDEVLQTKYNWREKSKTITTTKNGQLISNQFLSNGGTSIDTVWFENGKIKSRDVIFPTYFSNFELHKFRKDGSQYGYLKCEGGKLTGGYMLNPGGDTLWNSYSDMYKASIKAYDEDGIIDFKIDVGHDKTLFTEMNYYYSNGKVKEYINQNDKSKKEDLIEKERRAMNGKVKNHIEQIDSALTIKRYYYPNGNLEKEVREELGGLGVITNSFYNNGIVKQKYYGNASDYLSGDYINYTIHGRKNSITTYDKNMVIRCRSYNSKGDIIYDKWLNDKEDSAYVYDEVARVGIMKFNKGFNYYTETFYSGQRKKMIYNKNPETLDEYTLLYYPTGGLKKVSQHFADSSLVEIRTSYAIDGSIAEKATHTYNDVTVATYIKDNLKIINQYTTASGFDELKKVLILNAADTLLVATVENEGVRNAQFRNEYNQLQHITVHKEMESITIYYASGAPAADMPLKDYAIEGTMKFYEPSGVLLANINMEGNTKKGKLQIFGDNNRLVQEATYDYGQLTDKYSFWDKKGQLLLQITDIDTEREKQTYWNEETQKMTEF